jgi:hypothetical protein
LAAESKHVLTSRAGLSTTFSFALLLLLIKEITLNQYNQPASVLKLAASQPITPQDNLTHAVIKAQANQA